MEHLGKGGKEKDVNKTQPYLARFEWSAQI